MTLEISLQQLRFCVYVVCVFHTDKRVQNIRVPFPQPGKNGKNRVSFSWSEMEAAVETELCKDKWFVAYDTLGPKKQWLSRMN